MQNFNNPFFLDIEWVYHRAYELFTGGSTPPQNILDAWDNFYGTLQFSAFVSSLVLMVLVVWLWALRKRIIDAENEKYKVAESSDDEGESPAAAEWQEILELLGGTSPSDWRSAILHADAILDRMIKKMGYKGESLGERMKKIERSDFETLDQAWEAHKIRNKVAHPDSDFVLTQREADKVIDLYRQVFEEFHYI
jgi:hypothetical protein